MDDQVEFEKERKFLPDDDIRWREAAQEAVRCLMITQGYILIDPERGICRVRINRDIDGRFCDARIEVKLHATDDGAPELPPANLDETAAMKCLSLARGGVIEKIRHFVRCGTLEFHIDQFIGRHALLVIIELEHTDPSSITPAMLPPWVGEEVTGNRQYDNVTIAQQ
jgi:adenylate cyclase